MVAKARASVSPGDILASKYRVERVLGEGGMGVVVAARHVELDHVVAIKFLHPGDEDAELTRRFLKEARAAARLKSEHIVKTLDFGRLDDGSPFIVMEHLEGRDLGAELQRWPKAPPIAGVVTYLLHACDGVAEAHSLGIVHRDLKPANLFLTKGANGRPLVKVLDFGIAKSTELDADTFTLTKTNAFLGSPRYMSPEHMRSPKNADERSDIWSLGVIAYELLTGKPPFTAESMMDLCLKVAQDTAPTPSAVRPEIPEGLSRAVMRCLEKDPSQRFPNVAELAASLEPFAPAEEAGAARRMMEVLAAGVRPPMRNIAPAVASQPRPLDEGAISVPAAVSAEGWQHTRHTADARPKVPPFRWRTAAAGFLVVTAVSGVAFRQLSRQRGVSSRSTPSAFPSSEQQPPSLSSTTPTTVLLPATATPVLESAPALARAPEGSTSPAPSVSAARKTTPVKTGGPTKSVRVDSTKPKAAEPTSPKPGGDSAPTVARDDGFIQVRQ